MSLYGYTPNFNFNTRNPITVDCDDNGLHCKGYKGKSEKRVMKNGQYNNAMQCNLDSWRDFECSGEWGCCEWDSGKYIPDQCLPGDARFDYEVSSGLTRTKYCQKPFGGEDTYNGNNKPSEADKKVGINNPVQGSCRLKKDGTVILNPKNVKFVDGTMTGGIDGKLGSDKYHVECEYNESDFTYTGDNLREVVDHLEAYGNHFFDNDSVNGLRNAFTSYLFSQQLNDLCRNTETNGEYCPTNLGVNPEGLILNDYINQNYQNLYDNTQLNQIVDRRCSFFHSDNPDLKVKVRGHGEQNICTAWAEHVGGMSHSMGDRYQEDIILGPENGPYKHWVDATTGLNPDDHISLNQGSSYLGWPAVSESLRYYCHNLYRDILGDIPQNGILDQDLDDLCGCEMRVKNNNYSVTKNIASPSPYLLNDGGGLKFPSDGCWWPACMGGDPWKDGSAFIPAEDTLPENAVSCSLPINACINNIRQIVRENDGVEGDIEAAMDNIDVQNNCNFSNPQDEGQNGGDQNSESEPPLPPSPPPSPRIELSIEERRNKCMELLLPCDISCGKDYKDRILDTDYAREMEDDCILYWMEEDRCPPCPDIEEEEFTSPSSTPSSTSQFDLDEFIDQNTLIIQILIFILACILIYIFIRYVIIPLLFTSDKSNDRTG